MKNDNIEAFEFMFDLETNFTISQLREILP